jgi:hypothetical protein
VNGAKRGAWKLAGRERRPPEDLAEKAGDQSSRDVWALAANYSATLDRVSEVHIEGPDDDLVVITLAVDQVRRALQRTQARVLLVGGPGMGKSTAAVAVAHSVRRATVLAAWTCPSVRDVLAAVSRGAREEQVQVVDGLSDVPGGDEPALLESIMRAAGSNSILITSRDAPKELPDYVQMVTLANWDAASLEGVIRRRLRNTGLDQDELLALLASHGATYPVEVMGAVEAFVDGGREAAVRWISGQAGRSEPDLMLVRQPGGHVAVTGAVRMPDSALLAPSFAGLYAAPIVTLGRRRAAWSQEIAELEELVNSADVRESDLQRFFEHNPLLLTGVEYDRMVPHPVLARADGESLIPDFMLEVSGGTSDVLDLKLPTAPLLAGSKNRRRFGRSVIDALAQVREYGAYFDVADHRLKIHQQYGLRAYRPQLTVVIGRTPAVEDPLQLRRLWNDLPQHSKVMTYDELVARVKRLERARRG